jgi:hypothetical protein
MQDISAGFEQALRQQHQYATAVSLLDTDFNEVEGDTIFSKSDTNDITNFIADGSVDVDFDRGTRRTAELSLLNPSDEFTPATENFKSEGPWVGKIYLNRVVRIYRGLFVSGVPEYVPVGTFMIDKANVIYQSNMSLVNLTMSDLWKKLTKSYADRAYNFAKNTHYNDIIGTLVNDAGAAYPKRPNIDPLTDRDEADTKIPEILTLEDGASRGDFLKELVTTWDIDMYFDPWGRFTTQDRKSGKDKRSVWHFYTSEDQTGMLISIDREFSDDNLYNHVIVNGKDDKVSTRKEKSDTDPNSKTNIALIGDRVWKIADDKIKTANQAQKALDRAWAIRFQLGEVVQCQTICNPALEVDDVITITDLDHVKIDGRYRLRRFTVPLVSSLQDIQVTNIIYEDNL